MSTEPPPTGPSPEERRLALEEKKLEAELALLREEVEFRRSEVKAKELEARVKERESRRPTSAIVAALGFLAVTIVGACYNLRLKQREVEGNLMVAAARTESKIAMGDLLLFFIDAGAIRDRNGKIRKTIAEDPSSLPVYPTSLGVDPVDIVTGSPAVVLVVSHPGFDAPTTFRIPQDQSATLRLPGGDGFEMRAEILDPERRQVRLTLLPAANGPPAAIELVEGQVGTIEGPPGVGSLRVEVLRVILAATAEVPEDGP